MNILQEIIIEQESVNDDGVVILDLHFKNGDGVKAGDVVLEFETSKSTVEVDVLYDGFIQYNCKIGDEVGIGQIVAFVSDQQYVDIKNPTENKIIDETPKLVEEKEPTTFEQVNNNQHIGSISARETEPTSKTLFSRKAEILLKEKNLSKSDFKNIDFVNENDILAFIGEKPTPKIIESNENNNQFASQKENVTIEKITSQKKREIAYLNEVQSFSLSSNVSIIIEAEDVIEFLNDMPILKGSFLPIITYELSRLLKKYPKLNAYFQNDTIHYYNDVNVGIAMDMEKGLKVLKIEKTNTHSIQKIEKQIIDLSRKYLEDKTNTNDLTDITFTITDLSGAGISNFLPLINKNNSAILGVSSLDKKLKRLNLSVTFDHRITEGKYVSNFLYELKSRIESYSKVIDSPEEMPVYEYRCYKCRRKLSDNLNQNINFIKVLDYKGQEQLLCSVCSNNH